MIFSAKHGMYQAVLLGEKTLTTRLKLPAHITVGKEWAIVPKRAAPAWWLGGWTVGTDFDGTPFGDFVVTDPRKAVRETGIIASVLTPQEYLRACSFIQARIRIDAFWQTSLQFMSELEAFEEGVGSVKEYAALWDSINDRKGIRWADNPQVWRIRFHVPLDVAQAVSRVGKQAILDAVAGKAVQP